MPSTADLTGGEGGIFKDQISSFITHFIDRCHDDRIEISEPRSITFHDESGELDSDTVHRLEQTFMEILAENVEDEEKRDEMTRNLNLGQKLAIVREYERLKQMGSIQECLQQIDWFLQLSSSMVSIRDLEDLTLTLSSRPVDVIRYFVEKRGVLALNRLLSDSNYMGVELSPSSLRE